MASKGKEKAQILSDKTPSVKYNKRYDQVSWRSADTDFETDPLIGNGLIEVKKGKYYALCTRRNRKLSALIIVVIIFVIIMAALIYLYYSKPGVVTSTAIVTTDCGKLTGLIISLPYMDNVYKLNVFKGIPYALPPLGPLRWSPPQPLTGKHCWKGVLNAYKFGSKCAQGQNEGSEDCLYLNVYTPKLSVDANLPVIMWIHGGYLMTGSADTSSFIPNIEFAIAVNSVVVTINYRLNAFGFLTLKELWQKDISYGNYGLMDQILALKWIQKNIQTFGGNPNSVTICGHNAGGSSVFALLVSPQADGLFHKVISMSGLPKIDEPYHVAAKKNRKFLHETICANLTTSEIRACLYRLTKKQILHAVPYFQDEYWGFMEQHLLDFPLKGFIHGGLIVIDPLVVVTSPSNINSISHGNINKISVLIGSTAQEIGVAPLHHFDGSHQWIKYKNYLKQGLDIFSSNFINIVLGNLYSNKTMEENISSEFSTEFLHETITSDVRVNCPTNSLTRTFANSTKHHVYRYVVTHRPTTPITMFNYPAKFAFHMWDKIALFNFNIVSKQYSPRNNDLKFQMSLQDNFKHFMLFGHMENSDWGNGLTAVFNQNGSVVVLPAEYHERQCLFWNDPSNGFVPYAWSD